MYDAEMVKPMRTELTDVGVKELMNGEEVDSFLGDKSGSSLVFVNSVCGCSAGSARPGLIQSLKNDLKPDQVATVFAGVDKEATDKAREYFVGYPPSSPSMGLFREGQLVYMIERHDIEGTPPEDLSNWLKGLYNKYCGKEVDEAIEVEDPKSAREISVAAVKDLLDKGEHFLFLDVRDEIERQKAVIPNTTRLTEELAEEMLAKGNTDEAIVIHCHHGMRSLQAVQFFQQHGFTKVRSMTGGIAAWSNEIDNSIPQY